MITTQVQDNGVQAALQALSQRMDNMQPALQAIGEDIMERTKPRFGTSTGPDGRRWQGNALATIQALLHRQSGTYAKFSNLKTGKEGVTRVGNKKGFYLKNGNLSAGAQAGLGGKKLLIDTGSLARQFHVHADSASVAISNSMAYAAIHQFGGKAGKGRKVTIPARPFLPIMQNGEIYPAERVLILDAINDYLAGK